MTDQPNGNGGVKFTGPGGMGMEISGRSTLVVVVLVILVVSLMGFGGLGYVNHIGNDRVTKAIERQTVVIEAAATKTQQDHNGMTSAINSLAVELADRRRSTFSDRVRSWPSQAP